MVLDSTRRRPRHEIRTDCLVLDEQGRLLAERTLDASWDGLRVIALSPCRIGERVRVSLRVPRSDFWLTADGTVTRLIRGLRDHDEGRELGLRLDRMHGMDRLLLGKTLQRRPRLRGRRGPSRDYARTVLRIAERPEPRTPVRR